METRGRFAIAFVILLAGFLSSALTGDVTTFQASTGMNFNPNAGRYALGNVDRDPEGVIDYMDLVALKNLISVDNIYEIAQRFAPASKSTGFISLKSPLIFFSTIDK